MKSIYEGNKTQISIIAEPHRPDMICRFLLKMGLEVIAKHNADRIFDTKYDKARAFSLLGEKSHAWWYIQHENIKSVDCRIKTGVRPPEWNEPVKLEVVTFKNNAEIFYLKLFYLEMFTPLEPRVIPVLDETFKEPEYRTFFI